MMCSAVVSMAKLTIRLTVISNYCFFTYIYTDPTRTRYTRTCISDYVRSALIYAASPCRFILVSCGTVVLTYEQHLVPATFTTLVSPVLLNPPLEALLNEPPNVTAASRKRASKILTFFVRCNRKMSGHSLLNGFTQFWAVWLPWQQQLMSRWLEHTLKSESHSHLIFKPTRKRTAEKCRRHKRHVFSWGFWTNVWF